jgi:hypothetical protein
VVVQHDTAPTATMTAPANGASYPAYSGNNIPLQVTVGDTIGTITGLRFYANGQPVGGQQSNDGAGHVSTSFGTNFPGTYQVTAAVTNNDGIHFTGAPAYARRRSRTTLEGGDATKYRGAGLGLIQVKPHIYSS